jgi:hypothetical protein
MSPLQRIAMGFVLLVAPAAVRVNGYVWDALPDPLGWLLVLAGVRALRPLLDVRTAETTAWLALAASVPQWIPPLFEQLLPADDTAAASVRWAFFLPQAAFCVALARVIGQAALERQPPDRFVAGRYGVLLWLAGAEIVLPPVAYAVADANLETWSLVLIGVTNVAFAYYLFRVHRREWLGGPGPVGATPERRRPPS